MELQLPPKERAVLVLLIKNYPDALGKDEIIRNVWADDSGVSDDSLFRCISQIRKVLPEVGIESIYGYGYRLLPGNVLAASHLNEVIDGPVEAVELYLHATGLAQGLTEASLRQSACVFRSLISQYPNYLPARVGLAQTLATSIAHGHGANEKGESLYEEAKSHIDFVSRRSPNHLGLLRTQGVLFDVMWQFDAAEDFFLEALERAPNDTDLLLLYSWHLIAVGRCSDSIELLRKVVRQRPYSISTHTILARALACTGQYEASISEIVLAEQKYSIDNPIVAGTKIMIMASYCPTPSLIRPAKKLSVIHSLPCFSRVSFPYVLARCGRVEEAREEIQRVIKNNHSIGENILLVKALIAIGDFDSAARMIEAAYKARYGWLPFILRFPGYWPLRDHPTLNKVYTNIYASIKNIR